MKFFHHSCIIILIYHDAMEQNYTPIILNCQSTHTVTNRTLLVFQRFYVKLYIISLSSMQLRKPTKINFSLYKFTKIRCITSRENRLDLISFTLRHTARLLTIMRTLSLQPSKTIAVQCWTFKSNNIKRPIVTMHTCRSTKFEHLYNLFHCLLSAYLLINHITVRFSRCPDD